MGVEVAGKKIAVFHTEDGEFYAIDDHCTHASVPLSDGWLNGACVSCPWHGAEFDLKTGVALSLPATGKVNTFPVVVEQGQIWVEVSEDS